MKKTILSAIILFFVHCLFPLGVIAQSMEIDWAVEDSSSTFPSYFKEILCDKDSNIYIYGNKQGYLRVKDKSWGVIKKKDTFEKKSYRNNRP